METGERELKAEMSRLRQHLAREIYAMRSIKEIKRGKR